MTRARILADYVAGGTTAAEFDYLDGVTSNVQTQLDAKNPTRNENLKVVNDGWATYCDVDADYLTLWNSSNEALIVSSVNLTITITTAGLLGLDTGSEAANTWYHIWVISNGSATSGIFSTSSTSPTMPSGYTYKKYVGAARNDSSSNFIAMKQLGNHVRIPYDNVGSGIVNAWVTLDCSAFVPPTAKRVGIRCAINGGSTTGNVGGECALRVQPGESYGQTHLVNAQFYISGLDWAVGGSGMQDLHTDSSVAVYSGATGYTKSYAYEYDNIV